ncbi:hypothetical protein ES705_36572 [subsurface metagenome]
MYGLPFIQKFGFFTAVSTPALCEISLNSNGPVPTGSLFSNFVGSSILDQICSGTIGIADMEASTGVFCLENLKTTVSPSASTL